MRLKLFLLLLMAATLPSFAQSTGVAGTVVDNNTGAPVAGANVMLDKQGRIFRQYSIPDSPPRAAGGGWG